MNPLRVHAEHYRSFAELDLDLPGGCVAVLGENGAGKSSIVNAIDLALFGPQSRSLADYLADDALDEEMVLGLEFEHAGQLYRVRRTFSGRGRGKSALDFERWHEDVAHHDGRGDHELDEYSTAAWWPMTREDQKATQALIEETIGLSRETFRASAFLAQGDGAVFTEAQPRDRKRILCDVLGLEIWDRLLGLARSDIAKVDGEVTRLNLRMQDALNELAAKPALEARAADLEIELDDAEADLAVAENAHREAQEALASSRETATKLEAARQVLASREREWLDARAAESEKRLALQRAKDLPRAKAEAEKLAATVPLIEATLERVRAASEARATHERLVIERNRLLGDASALNEEAHALREEAKLLEENGPGATVCDRCSQTLGAEALAATLVSMRSEADEKDAKATAIDVGAKELEPAIDEAAAALGAATPAEDVAQLQSDLRAARGARETLASIETRLEQVEGLRADLGQIEAKLPETERLVHEQRTAVAELEDALPEGDLEATVARAYGTLVEARNEALGVRQRQAVTDAELERLGKLEAGVAQQREELNGYQGQLDELKLCERAYGRDGIPALILENAAIPQIELEASRILAELGTSFRVELRTQREKKDGGLRDTLDIVILSENGERNYETFSGGERTRLNLALRIALARLLAHRRGAESRLLVIDEPEFLDEAGVSRLADVLRGLSGDFDRILLISHVPTLASSFDQVLQVVKGENGRSQIEGAEVLEAVA